MSSIKDEKHSDVIASALGKIKDICKSVPHIIPDIVSVLRVICDIRDNSSLPDNLKEIARKAYDKAIKRVPFKIKADVESQLKIKPPVCLDELRESQILTEAQKLSAIRPLFVALYGLLCGSKDCEDSHQFSCDNKEKPAVGYPAIIKWLNQLRTGEKVWDADMENLLQRIRNCNNRNSCAECRSLYVIFLMLRDPLNHRILYDVCRSVHDGSLFSREALISFLRLPTVLGPDSVLASVIEDESSIYLPSVIRALTEMSAVETPEEEEARHAYDKEMDDRFFNFFLIHSKNKHSKIMVYSDSIKDGNLGQKVETTVKELRNPRTREARRLQLISLLRIYVNVLKSPSTTDPDDLCYIKQRFMLYLDSIPKELRTLVDSLQDSSSVKQEPSVCSICCNDFSDNVLTCGHKLCGDCTGKILSGPRKQCPFCQKPDIRVVCKEICLTGICGHCDLSKKTLATHCYIECGHRVCCNDCAIQKGNSKKKCPSCGTSSSVLKIFDST